MLKTWRIQNLWWMLKTWRMEKYWLSRKIDEEDLNARELLRRAYSAGPVSPICFDV
jgi:hypothetical protein